MRTAATQQKTAVARRPRGKQAETRLSRENAAANARSGKPENKCGKRTQTQN